MYKQLPLPVAQLAKPFVNEQNGIVSVEEALIGAKDILAEYIAEHLQTREKIRRLFLHKGVIVSKVIKGKEADGDKYRIYFDNKEPIKKLVSHRILAMFRGEEEGILRLKVEINEIEALEAIDAIHLKADNEAADIVAEAIEDSYKRLLQPQMETEMRQMMKEKADKDAIGVFSENVRQLLLAPPLGQKMLMAIDPGFRTGCKVVVLDKQGNLLENDTIYPHPPQIDVYQANEKLKHLAQKYQVEAIAIGNGTAGQETKNF